MPLTRFSTGTCSLELKATVAAGAGRRGAARHGCAHEQDEAERGVVAGGQPRPARASMTEELSIFLDLLFNKAVDVAAVKGNCPLAVDDLGSVRSRQNQDIVGGIVG